jgi:hypothetical protein
MLIERMRIRERNLRRQRGLRVPDQEYDAECSY